MRHLLPMYNSKRYCAVNKEIYFLVISHFMLFYYYLRIWHFNAYIVSKVSFQQFVVKTYKKCDCDQLCYDHISIMSCISTLITTVNISCDIAEHDIVYNLYGLRVFRHFTAILIVEVFVHIFNIVVDLLNMIAKSVNVFLRRIFCFIADNWL